MNLGKRQRVKDEKLTLYQNPFFLYFDIKNVFCPLHFAGYIYCEYL